jgi:hypothetical protein
MKRENRPHLGSITKDMPAQAQEDKQYVFWYGVPSLVYVVYDGFKGAAGLVAGLALGLGANGIAKDGNSKGNNNCDYC